MSKLSITQKNLAIGMIVGISGVAVLGWAFFVLTAWTASEALRQKPTPQKRENQRKAVPLHECERTNDLCRLAAVTDGQETVHQGICIRHRCVPAHSGCTHSIDCFDGNPCRQYHCILGQCVSIPARENQICEFSEKKRGQCRRGSCEENIKKVCTQQSVAKDCPKAENTCFEAVCSPQNQCEYRTQKDGAECYTSFGAPGVCQAGVCVLDRQKTLERKPKCYYQRIGYYRLRRCNRGAKYILSIDDIKKTSTRLEQIISKSLRYDVHVSFVYLPDGGYNIIVTNRRTSKELRGLMDPSFIAWYVADFTSNTNWRSQNLLIWLEPYKNGWVISTQGGRSAVLQARKASPLGVFGVINASTFRAWLERSFQPLPATPPLKPILVQRNSGK